MDVHASLPTELWLAIKDHLSTDGDRASMLNLALTSKSLNQVVTKSLYSDVLSINSDDVFQRISKSMSAAETSLKTSFFQDRPNPFTWVKHVKLWAILSSYEFPRVSVSELPKIDDDADRYVRIWEPLEIKTSPSSRRPSKAHPNASQRPGGCRECQGNHDAQTWSTRCQEVGKMPPRLPSATLLTLSPKLVFATGAHCTADHKFYISGPLNTTLAGIERLKVMVDYTDICVPAYWETSESGQMAYSASQIVAYMRGRDHMTRRDFSKDCQSISSQVDGPRTRAAQTMVLHGANGMVIKRDSSTNGLTVFVGVRALVRDRDHRAASSFACGMTDPIMMDHKGWYFDPDVPPTNFWVDERIPPELIDSFKSQLRNASLRPGLQYTKAAKLPGGRFAGTASYKESCAVCGKSWY